MSLLDWRPAVLAPLCIAAAVAVGCGGTVIDDSKTEAVLKQNLTKAGGEKVESVDCPSGVDVKAGATFECQIKLAEGKEQTATLKILNSNADVEVTGLKPSK